MRRRTFLKSGIASAALLAGSGELHAQEAPLKPPNILWLSAEDLSPDLGCYGDTYATTPNLDAFAKRAIRYDRAFSHAGVCAPSRSGLITGMYPTTIGTQHMRCSGIPPAGVKCFPEYLRAAGYYCTNNSKTDYQFEPPLSAWDENSKKAHWKNRPEGAPFFSVFNSVTTHEGQVRSRDPERLAQIEALGDLRHDPAGVTLPPYHADTPATRKDWAQYHDLITLMDREVGEALAELEAAGLAEDTIIWFWGDHGRGLTRCKRWLYDSGTRVPLLVHVPEKYRAWVCPDAPDSLAPGNTDRLVSFIDFAPTILSIAGVALPGHFQGQAFLGKETAPPREYVFGARDRMDEAYDCIRTVRDKRFRYFRNYMPWLTYAQRIEYMDQMPMAQDLRRLHGEGKLDAVQSLWFAGTKPEEELYDLDADPHEINNLAGDPAFEGELQRLRKVHLEWAHETKDLGYLPEPEMDALKWPGGRAPRCARPALWETPTGLALASGTPGSSVLYRLKGESSGWRLYTTPLDFALGDGLLAVACRIGFEDSEAVTFAPQSIGVFGPPTQRVDEWNASLQSGFQSCPLLNPWRCEQSRKPIADFARRFLGSSVAADRYWAVVSLHRRGWSTSEDQSELLRLLDDPSPVVRIAAAQAVHDGEKSDLALPVLIAGLADPSQSVRLHAAIALRDLGKDALPALDALKAATKDPWTYVARVSLDAVAALEPERESEITQ
ncbi:MAG: sulfatase-like hydrolase/transferase [Candidatus Hydrogenedentes bacterium]|nr:sulfatase-like hydrolase/transferase [Candidatus Hydrogenedentota bacterium]